MYVYEIIVICYRSFLKLIGNIWNKSSSSGLIAPRKIFLKNYRPPTPLDKKYNRFALIK